MSASEIAKSVNTMLVEAFKELEDAARLDLFEKLRSNFCMHCGSAHLPCHCWNDE